MKKILIAVLMSVILICSSSFGYMLFLNKKQANQNRQEAEKILNLTTELLECTNNNCDFEDYEKSTIVLEKNMIGILKIPKLNIEAPIKEGTSQEVMRTSIGHFTESDYWDGNVSLASHNSGTSMHYFQDLHQLDIGDEITYKTCLGERRYSVESTTIIDDTDWAMVIKNNNLNEDSINTITLITCINGKPDKRLCVRGVEK